MEHFPPSDTVPLTEPEIPPHFAAQQAQNGAPNYGPSSHRSFAEETTLGEDHISQGHSRPNASPNETLWQVVGNGSSPPQQDPQQADKPQSPPPRTQIRYPTLPPSPPAVPASEQTYPHRHPTESSMCHTRDCGWKVAYLKLHRITRRLIDETEESVRGFRWAVDDMEREMNADADAVDGMDGGWRGCEPAPGVKGGAGASMGEVGREAVRGVESSVKAPLRGGGDEILDQVVYPDLRSILARLEKEDGEVARGVETSTKNPPQDKVLGRVVYPTLPSVPFGGKTIVERLA